MGNKCITEQNNKLNNTIIILQEHKPYSLFTSGAATQKGFENKFLIGNTCVFCASLIMYL